MKILFGKMSESGNIRHEGILLVKDDFRRLEKTKYMLYEVTESIGILVHRWKTYKKCVETRKKTLYEYLKVNITG